MVAIEDSRSYRIFVAHDDVAECSIDWYYGKRSPHVQGWVSEHYNELTPAHQMIRRCPARPGTYVTVFGLSEADMHAGLRAATKVDLNQRRGTGGSSG